MNGKIRKVLIAIFCIIAIGCAAYLAWYYIMADKTDKSNEKAKQVAETVKTEMPKTEQPEEAEAPEIPIDFAKLQETNPDVHAWIKIEGTNIDYPILQNLEEDNFYLNHSWEGAKASQGAIYTQACNAKDFTDFNTIIYGHQMGGGNNTMFHDLDKYLDADFMASNPNVTIYTPEHILTYRIFATVIYDDRHLFHFFNYVMDAERQSFLDSLANTRDLRNQYLDSESVTIQDKIISLSTCIAAEPEHRLLVEAVLIDEK